MPLLTGRNQFARPNELKEQEQLFRACLRHAIILPLILVYHHPPAYNVSLAKTWRGRLVLGRLVWNFRAIYYLPSSLSNCSNNWATDSLDMARLYQFIKRPRAIDTGLAKQTDNPSVHFKDVRLMLWKNTIQKPKLSFSFMCRCFFYLSLASTTTPSGSPLLL